MGVQAVMLARIATAVLICVGLAQARPGPDSNYNLAIGGFTPSCSQSSSFLARATSVTSNTDKTNYDTLICGMVTDGTFAQIDVLYIFTAIDATTARLNLIANSFNATEHGTVTFSAYHGFTGDGSSGYEDTGFVPPSAGGHYSQDSASLGIYSLSGGTPTSFPVLIGTSDGVNAIGDMFFSNSPAINARVNTSSTVSASTSTTAGLFIAVRTSSSSEGISINGGAPATSSTGSFAITNEPSIVVFGANVSGTVGSFTAKQFSGALIGGALSNTDIVNISSRINTYMTAYGINVY